MPASPSDEALMMHLCDGDEEALNTLMDRWGKPVVGFTVRYCWNYRVAADLAQETFVKVYENRRCFCPSGKFSTWIFAITINLCRNHSRWKSRPPLGSTSTRTEDDCEADLLDKIADSAEQPDHQAIQTDEGEMVRSAVLELPHDLKTAVILSEFHGMSHCEIAEIARSTPKAVEARLDQARHFLRKKLIGLVELD